MQKQEKLRILAIAPYEGLNNMITTAAARRPDLSVKVITADLEAGAAAVRRHQNNGFDAILSRGGTTQLIEEVSSLPVIEIPISGYDILRSIRIAQSFEGKVAIVGFPSITNSVQLICELLDMEAEIITLHAEQEAHSCIAGLCERGFSLVIGDQVAVNAARAQGLNVILITSGTESIEQAFDQAIRVCRSFQRERKKSLFYDGLLKKADTLFAFWANGELVYNNAQGEDAAQLEAFLSRHVQNVLMKGEVRLARQTNAYVWQISGDIQNIAGQEYVLFRCRKQEPVFPTQASAVQYRNIDDKTILSFNTFYRSSPSMEFLVRTIQEYAESGQPVLIKGETGTDKDCIAAVLQAQGPYSLHPLVQINCEMLDTKRWDALFENAGSPLAQTHRVLHFKNIQAMSEDSIRRLSDYIQNTALTKRSRLIFSWATDESNPNGKAVFELANLIECLKLELPPLRQRKKNIPSLAGLYLSQLNQLLSKQVVGFEPEAMRLLTEYSWPQNLSQFRRVLKELCSLTQGAYIKAEQVAELLLGEETYFDVQPLYGIALSGTLQTIERAVIQKVLEEENFNQTKAARRLGIGRSTLWRKIR